VSDHWPTVTFAEANDSMKPKTKKTAKRASGSLQPDCCAASKDLALQCWMQDVTSLLCYQPEVPHAHKESLVKALDHYNKQCAELDEAKRHNDQGEPQPAHRGQPK